ncbi:hypothetical protein LCGC14_1149450, partial [marine sediment metagenome]
PGESKTIIWKVKNTGTGFLNDCVFEGFGDYLSWVSYGETKNLAAGEEYDFIFDLNIPENVGFGSYELGVVLNCKEASNLTKFNVEIIEKKFLFKVIKSTELVKFLIYDHYNVFLPLLQSDLSFNYEKLANHAKKFYDKINTLYLKYKKKTTKHKSLMENMNRWSKLINQRQSSKIKVVYNNSGSILNSSVIQGNFLVTGDLSFYDSDNLCEAYYLSAILNSNVMTTNVKIMKSSRHIFKIPLDIPIKKFNEKSQNHCKLAELGKNGQETAKSTVLALLEKNKNNLSKFKIQNILRKKLARILTQIDEILLKELRSS